MWTHLVCASVQENHFRCIYWSQRWITGLQTLVWKRFPQLHTEAEASAQVVVNVQALSNWYSNNAHNPQWCTLTTILHPTLTLSTQIFWISILTACLWPVQTCFLWYFVEGNCVLWMVQASLWMVLACLWMGLACLWMGLVGLWMVQLLCEWFWLDCEWVCLFREWFRLLCEWFWLVCEWFRLVCELFWMVYKWFRLVCEWFWFFCHWSCCCCFFGCVSEFDASMYGVLFLLCQTGWVFLCVLGIWHWPVGVWDCLSLAI